MQELQTLIYTMYDNYDSHNKELAKKFNDPEYKIPVLTYLKDIFYEKYNIILGWDTELNYCILVGNKKYNGKYEKSKTRKSEDISKMANGIIFDKDCGKIICGTYKKLLTIDSDKLFARINTSNADSDSNINIDKDTSSVKFNINNYIISEMYDGTIIKVFYDGGKWNVSTNKYINAYRANWCSKISFGEYFDEINLDYNSLNKKYSYTYILIHPANRLICKYYARALILICVFDNENLIEVNDDPMLFNLTEIDINKYIYAEYEENILDMYSSEKGANENKDKDKGGDMSNINKIFIPKIVKFNDIVEIKESFERQNKKYGGMKYIFPGYILTHKKSGIRYKLFNPAFLRMYILKGNAMNMNARYKQLNTRDKKIFRKFFLGK